MTLHINLQDVRDAQAMSQVPPHEGIARQVLKEGGIVKITDGTSSLTVKNTAELDVIFPPVAG